MKNIHRPCGIKKQANGEIRKVVHNNVTTSQMFPGEAKT